jgi:predicted transcriptional regulator
VSASSRFSKGGSSAFLKTLRTSRRSERRSERRGGVSELVSIMTYLQDGPKELEEIAQRFPFAEKIVYNLVSDHMVERQIVDKDTTKFGLTERGEDFLKRRMLYT